MSRRAIRFKTNDKGWLMPVPEGTPEKKRNPHTSHPQVVNEGPVPFIFIKSVSVPDPKAKYGRKSYASKVLQHLKAEDAAQFHFKGYGFIMGDALEYLGREKDAEDIIEEHKETSQVVTPGQGKAKKVGDIKEG